LSGQGWPAIVPDVLRLGTLLGLVALATAQVPLIACVSDCHEVVFAGVAPHACHESHPCGTRPDHAGHAGCAVAGCHHEGGGHGAPGRPDAEHHVIQVPVLVTGSVVALPSAAVAPAMLLAAAPRVNGSPAPALLAASGGDGGPAAPAALLDTVRLLR
jgi:hypothetical protein